MVDYLEREIYPIVIDNGSGSIKSGVAGEDAPYSIIPSYIGTTKHQLYPGVDKKDTYIGSEAEARRDELNLRYPISCGIVQDWDDMEAIWQHIYDHELKVDPKDQPTLLTEAPMNPKGNREKMTEVMFERFEVPMFYVSLQAVLSVYASGRGSAVCCESGDGVTHIVPIYEGYTIPSSIQKVELGGRDLTNYMVDLLKPRGYNFTISDLETVRGLKEAMCYVSQDYEKEIENASCSAEVQKSYQLPDGSEIILGQERFKCPEALFNPCLIGKEIPGIHKVVMGTLQKCDMDMRRDLYCNIVLSGGNTMFDGFSDRMQKELEAMIPPTSRVKVVAPPERKLSTWIGGSILASLTTFAQMWITKDDYDEYGPTIVHRKCF